MNRKELISDSNTSMLKTLWSTLMEKNILQKKWPFVPKKLPPDSWSLTPKIFWKTFSVSNIYCFFYQCQVHERTNFNSNSVYTLLSVEGITEDTCISPIWIRPVICLLYTWKLLLHVWVRMKPCLTVSFTTIINDSSGTILSSSIQFRRP